MVFIAAVMIIAIYLACPIVGKIALLLANTILPDPVPFADEFIMWVGLFAHLSRLMKISEFIREHKTISIAVVITLIALFILLFILLI